MGAPQGGHVYEGGGGWWVGGGRESIPCSSLSLCVFSAPARSLCSVYFLRKLPGIGGLAVSKELKRVGHRGDGASGVMNLPATLASTFVQTVLRRSSLVRMIGAGLARKRVAFGVSCVPRYHEFVPRNTLSIRRTCAVPSKDSLCGRTLDWDRLADARRTASSAQTVAVSGAASD